jgi:polyadenylate-binding protein
LYVGDLQQDVTEALLFEIFNQAGPVSSIRVCRDAATRRSLGYAYVNFHNVMDAERALDTLNFTPIKGRPCRIMWSHRDPSIRKSSSSNIFIKNLDKSIDNKALYDTFSSFGNILSCKVAMDGNMQSKGYGFVHYETEEGAQEAIQKVNGMMLSGKKVFVGKFERRSERPGAGGAKYTNVYVKNIPLDWSDDRFEKEFSRFGKITSVVLQKGPDGKHKGFGFVNYESHEEASHAVDDGSKIHVGDDRTLFVDRFQKKAERSALLAKKFDDIRREKSEKYRNLNLYVKNLDDDVEDSKLRDLFTPFGEITSAVVMRDEKGNSKGFGFVCFANSDDATKALNEMNGKMMGSKPIYVNRAQRKEERRMQLENQFQANLAGQRMQPMPPVYYPNMAMPQPALMFQQQMMAGRRFGPAQPMRTYPLYPQQRVRNPQQQAPGRPGVPINARHHPQPNKYGGGRGSSPATAGGPRYPAPRDHHQTGPIAVPSVQAPVVGGHAPTPAQDLTAQLASSTPEMQKQLLGERLFPLIQKEQPNLAGKITGMLLEMDVSEILSVLDTPHELHSKIQEALEVLQAHATVDSS